MKTFLAIFTVLAGLTVFSSPGAQAVSPVSTTVSGGVSGAGNSFTPAFSADGRFVVFLSHANNLVTNDDRGLNLDVFVRDLVASNTTLASVNTSGIGGGNADASDPCLSSNGQFVVFASFASNLVIDDTNNACDVFVRDLVANTTTLVSVNANGTGSALGPAKTAKYPLESRYPLISADGHWTAFQSSASNLVAWPDTNRAPDVFLRDLLSGTTRLVSINAPGARSANDKSELAGMTPDGRFIAFTSRASDLVAGVDGSSEELYVRDMVNGITYWASSNLLTYLPAGYRCFFPVLSADGNYVAFKAEALGEASPTNALVFFHELAIGKTTLLDSNSFNSTAPSMNNDGRFTAFDSTRELYGAFYGKIYLWDLMAQTSSVVSLSSAEGFCHCPATGTASTPVLSSDGSKIAFLFALDTSAAFYAKPLTSNTVNSLSQLYVRDLTTSNNVLASIRQDGTATDDALWLTAPALSADGSKVAFESRDEWLVAGDNNRASDVFVRDSATDTTDLVSARHPALPAETGSGNSWLGPNCVSADGKVVVFTALDGTLAEADTNSWPDTYARSMETPFAMPLPYPFVEPYNDGGGPSAPYTNLFLEDRKLGAPYLSANGRFATFMNVYSSGSRSIGWRDLTSTNASARPFIIGTIDAFSTPYTMPAANPFIPSPVSSDGRFVVFQSKNAPPQWTDYVKNNYEDIFVSYASNHTFLLTANSSGYSGNRPSIKPTLSPDDRWVVFQSQATDLKPNVPGGSACQLFAMDFGSYFAAYQANTNVIPSPTSFMRLLSCDASGMGLSDGFTGAVFSANSRYVAFYGITNLTIYRHDLYANTTNLVVCTNCLNPSLSADGRFVVYEGWRGSSLTSDVYVKDLQTGDTQLVNVNYDDTAPGNAGATSAQISPDGRFIVFASRASDLVQNDSNTFTDVFVRDCLQGVTTLVSLNQPGTGSGNGPSSNPVMAADGRTIVFQSFATDLAPGVYNDTRNIFLVRLGGPDTDHDRLPDDWELAYFGNLSRDGSGDFDEDGLTDLQEYQAGTDPTNSGSVLRALVLAPVGGGVAHVIWNAVPGKTYRVQFKDNVNDPGWTDLPGPLTAVSSTASLLDASAPANQRFYRVVLVP